MLSKKFAIGAVIVKTIAVLALFVMGLFVASNDGGAVFGLTFLAAIFLIFEWIAVINAEHSSGWGIVLVIFAVLTFIQFNFINLIIGTIYLVYGIISIQDN